MGIEFLNLDYEQESRLQRFLTSPAAISVAHR
jgi:hypothetical protein